MVKLHLKVVIAATLIGAAVPANAMLRSFTSRIGKSFNCKRSAVLAGSSLFAYGLYSSSFGKQSQSDLKASYKNIEQKSLRGKWLEVEPQSEFIGGDTYLVNGSFVEMSNEKEYSFFSNDNDEDIF